MKPEAPMLRKRLAIGASWLASLNEPGIPLSAPD